MSSPPSSPAEAVAGGGSSPVEAIAAAGAPAVSVAPISTSEVVGGLAFPPAASPADAVAGAGVLPGVPASVPPGRSGLPGQGSRWRPRRCSSPGMGEPSCSPAPGRPRCRQTSSNVKNRAPEQVAWEQAGRCEEEGDAYLSPSSSSSLPSMTQIASSRKPGAACPGAGPAGAAVSGRGGFSLRARRGVLGGRPLPGPALAQRLPVLVVRVIPLPGGRASPG